MIALTILLSGLAASAFGMLCTIASLMPNFGGGSDEKWLLPVGLSLFGGGIAVVFYAGTLI